jgi:tight adherence protein B
MPADPLVLLPLLGLVGGIAVLVGMMVDIGRRRAELQDEVAKAATHGGSGGHGDSRTRRLDQALAASPTLRRAVEVTADLAERRGALGSVERSLRAADVPVRPAELILAHIVATLVLPIVVLVVTGSPIKAATALVVAAVVPPLTLKTVVARRRKRFAAQLPDALVTLSGSLRAGRSVGQAMAAISREMPDPMGRELRKVIAEVRLGRPLNEALHEAAARIGSVDFDWAVLAMQIQGEVGGNLAELLDQVAATIRERSRMKGEVKALTAEGRASALMLVFMVPGLGLTMAAMNPEYMEPLFSTTTGRIMLGISAVMVGGGYLWMNSMVKIDV